MKATAENPYSKYPKAEIELQILKLEAALKSGKPNHMNKVWKENLSSAKEALRMADMLPRGIYVCIKSHSFRGKEISKGDNMEIRTESEEFDNYVCEFPHFKKWQTIGRDEVLKYWDFNPDATATTQKTFIVEDGKEKYEWEVNDLLDFCLNPSDIKVYISDKELVQIDYAKHSEYYFFSTRVLWDRVEFKGSQYGVFQSERKYIYLENLIAAALNEIKEYHKHLSKHAVNVIGMFTAHYKINFGKEATLAPFVKEVDGLQQTLLFDLPEEKKIAKPDELFGYIAKDKIDRQRYKRKQTQLLEKLEQLPAKERNALLRAINNKFTPPLF